MDGDVDKMEVRLRGDVRTRLNAVRQTLINALDKVGRSIQEIRTEVEQGTPGGGGGGGAGPRWRRLD